MACKRSGVRIPVSPPILWNLSIYWGSRFLQTFSQTRGPSTYNDYISYLRPVLTDIGEEHLMEGITKVKANASQAMYFQTKQIQKLKKAIQERDPELWLAVQFIYYCFIRPGELRWLKAGVSAKELQMQLRHHSLDQVNAYLRQMGVMDMDNLVDRFPEI